jgi:hypothetical protein
MAISFSGGGSRSTRREPPSRSMHICYFFQTKPFMSSTAITVVHHIIYKGPGWLNELSSLDYLTTHTSLSPIRRGFPVKSPRDRLYIMIDSLIYLFIVFKVTFSNISAISWRPDLVVEEA